MVKHSNEPTVLTTPGSPSRAQVTAARWVTGDLLLAPMASYQGTGLSFVGGADGATPRVRIDPSGTPTWSPPV